MRDRLIEILKKVPRNTRVFYDQFADYLLKNGVIVPPCKVGQTLYLARQDVQKIIEVIVMAIIQRHTFQYAEVLIVEDNRDSLITLAYWGDRLFPTKEEAEQALSKLQASYEQVKGGAE